MKFELGIFGTFRQFFSVRFPLKLINLELGILVTFLHLFSVGSKLFKNVSNCLIVIMSCTPKTSSLKNDTYNFSLEFSYCSTLPFCHLSTY